MKWREWKGGGWGSILQRCSWDLFSSLLLSKKRTLDVNNSTWILCAVYIAKKVSLSAIITRSNVFNGKTITIRRIKGWSREKTEHVSIQNRWTRWNDVNRKCKCFTVYTRRVLENYKKWNVSSQNRWTR